MMSRIASKQRTGSPGANRFLGWVLTYWAAACLLSASPLPPCDDPAGTIDSTFIRPPDLDSFVGAALDTVELPDRRILVGLFETYSTGGENAVERSLMVRLQADGTLDPSFTFESGALERVGAVHAFAVASNGVIAAATSGIGTEGFFYGHLHIT